MKDTLRDTIVGLTALVGVAGLIVILLLFGELKVLTEATYEFSLRLNTAVGLNSGSPVTLNGVPIGEVVDLNPSTFPDPGVEVRVRVAESVRVPRESSVTVLIGLLGEGTLQLTAPQLIDRMREPDYIEAGETIERQASTLLDELSELLDRRLVALNEAASSIVRVSNRFTLVGERLTELLAPRTPEEVDSGASPPNVSSAIARIDQAISGVDEVVSDPEVRAEVRQSIADFAQTLAEARRAFTVLGGAAESIQTRADNLGGAFEDLLFEIARTADAASRTLEDLQLIVKGAEEGRGTLGQLLTNPDLYRSLDDAAKRLEKVLVETQLLLEKIQAEGVPIDF